MKLLRLLLPILFCISISQAADLVVKRAQLSSPSGVVSGKLVMLGDRMVFVDDNQPDMSFVIPRADVRRAHLEGGELTMDLVRPYTPIEGHQPQSTVVLLMPDQASAGNVVTWIGAPANGYRGEASRARAYANQPHQTETVFDVRNGDQRGKLILQHDQVRFESLTDAKHSRTWTYAEIRELRREHDGKEIDLEPYHGDTYEFQFENPARADAVYHAISDRLVQVRTHGDVRPVTH